MTYTYAVLEVPRAVYAAVRALLARADYSHAFHDGRDGEVIDMHGIALKSTGGPIGADITVGTLLSSQTKEGRVEFSLNGELTQKWTSTRRAKLLGCYRAPSRPLSLTG